jgi:cyclic beta-1,2-glucan synthetase
MYRAGVEWILGFRLRGSGFPSIPAFPRAWPGFQITFRYHSSLYEIRVRNPNSESKGVSTLSLDGVTLEPDSELDLVDDGGTHQVEVVLG